ncbi:Pleckstrin homology domain-containing family B member 2 [Frankliniella fusca]|uniref:Pleckstrin homology domain-containing family B member 2 n=1 Tax=Frankliniella fusca TaxID=407009 RepID=A0AAE1HSU5_9NEOP|nr:Pleckstrin homology domain-containing family B member 2 [Frankliniella fusca]
MAARQIKGGYLLRHKKRLLGPSTWREQWVVLYDDSTLSWYKEKGRPRPEGSVRVRESPDLLAVSQYTQRIPDRPDLPKGNKVAQLLAVGCRRPSRHKVHWLLAKSTEECHEWMTAISRTTTNPTLISNKLPQLPPLPPPKDQSNGHAASSNGTAKEEKDMKSGESRVWVWVGGGGGGASSSSTAELREAQIAGLPDNGDYLGLPRINKRFAKIVPVVDRACCGVAEGTVDLPAGLLAGAGVSQAWGGWGHGGGWAVGVGLCGHSLGHSHHVQHMHVHQHAPTPHGHASAHAYDHQPTAASATAYHHDCSSSAMDTLGHHDVDLGDLDLGGLDCLADFSF